MRRSVRALAFLFVLVAAPIAAFGDPPGELASIQALPIIFDGQCVGRVVNGQRQRLPCEVRTKDGWLWSRDVYYLIIWTGDRQSVLTIMTFRVWGDEVLYDEETAERPAGAGPRP